MFFFFKTDFIFAVPSCPIEFPAPHFPTEHRPHLAFAGGRSESVSLADSWDSSACTSLASGSGYLSPRLTAIQGSPSTLKADTTKHLLPGTFIQSGRLTTLLEKKKEEQHVRWVESVFSNSAWEWWHWIIRIREASCLISSTWQSLCL